MRTHLMVVWFLIASAAMTSLLGCNSFDASQWNEAKVTNEIIDQWNLNDVTLTRVDGGYEGSGKDSSGETFKIKVIQNANDKSASGTADGDRGTSLSFSVRPTQQ